MRYLTMLAVLTVMISFTFTVATANSGIPSPSNDAFSLAIANPATPANTVEKANFVLNNATPTESNTSITPLNMIQNNSCSNLLSANANCVSCVNGNNEAKSISRQDSEVSLFAAGVTRQQSREPISDAGFSDQNQNRGNKAYVMNVVAMVGEEGKAYSLLF